MSYGNAVVFYCLILPRFFPRDFPIHLEFDTCLGIIFVESRIKFQIYVTIITTDLST